MNTSGWTEEQKRLRDMMGGDPAPPIPVRRFRQSCIHMLHAAVDLQESNKTDNELMRRGLWRTIRYAVCMAFELAIKAVSNQHGHNVRELWGNVPPVVRSSMQRSAQRNLNRVHPSKQIIPLDEYFRVHAGLFQVVSNRYEEDIKDWIGYSADMGTFFTPPPGDTSGMYLIRLGMSGFNNNAAFEDGWLILISHWLSIMQEAIKRLPDDNQEEAEVGMNGVLEAWIYGRGVAFCGKDSPDVVGPGTVFGRLNPDYSPQQ